MFTLCIENEIVVGKTHYFYEAQWKLNATEVLRMLHCIDTMEFVKVVLTVVNTVVLQALLSVGQLTAQSQHSVNQSLGNYVIDIISPDLHTSEMKQVNVGVTVIYILA